MARSSASRTSSSPTGTATGSSCRTTPTATATRSPATTTRSRSTRTASAKPWPAHDLPKEIKHYYAREAYQADPDDPLAHPKLGASYQVSRWNDTLRWSDLERLNRELEEAIHSVLANAGLDTSPQHGNGGFVEDAYFDASLHEPATEPTTLELASIKQEQKNVVIEYLSDGLSDVQLESLETLATDGGQISPQRIADDHDRHVGSVRRALRGIEDLVDRGYGEVGLRSDFIGEMVYQAIADARDAVKNAAKTVVDASRADRVSKAWAKFEAFCDRYGIDFRRRDDDSTLDLGTIDPDDDPDPQYPRSSRLPALAGCRPGPRAVPLGHRRLPAPVRRRQQRRRLPLPVAGDGRVATLSSPPRYATLLSQRTA